MKLWCGWTRGGALRFHCGLRPMAGRSRQESSYRPYAGPAPPFQDLPKTATAQNRRITCKVACSPRHSREKRESMLLKDFHIYAKTGPRFRGNGGRDDAFAVAFMKCLQAGMALSLARITAARRMGGRRVPHQIPPTPRVIKGCWESASLSGQVMSREDRIAHQGGRTGSNAQDRRDGGGMHRRRPTLLVSRAFHRESPPQSV
jgi:hypothetical protein